MSHVSRHSNAIGLRNDILGADFGLQALIQTLNESTDQTYEELLSHLRETLIPQYDQKAQISSTHPLVRHSYRLYYTVLISIRVVRVWMRSSQYNICRYSGL